MWWRCGLCAVFPVWILCLFSVSVVELRDMLEIFFSIFLYAYIFAFYTCQEFFLAKLLANV